MNKAWKKFVIVVSVLLCVIIVCVSVNVMVDTITGNIHPQTNVNSQQQNGVGNNNQNGGAVQQGTPDVNDQQAALTPGGDSSQQSPNNAGQQGGNAQNNSNNPLNYNKSQLVDYYNAALKKSYTYKINVSKVENVTVEVGKVNIKAGFNVDATKMAKSIISNNTQKNGVVQTKSFVGGKSTDDGTAVQKFVLPTNLYADAVQDIDIIQNGQGYKMVIKLKSETCAHNGVAKYNASCSWPLDVGVINFGQAVSIQECTFNYPGTVLTAMIDAQGRVYAVQTDMPLHVSNAKATAVGATITVESIDGRWVCKNELKFL